MTILGVSRILGIVGGVLGIIPAAWYVLWVTDRSGVHTDFAIIVIPVVTLALALIGGAGILGGVRARRHPISAAVLQAISAVLQVVAFPVLIFTTFNLLSFVMLLAVPLLIVGAILAFIGREQILVTPE